MTKLRIGGAARDYEAPDDMTLLWAIRDLAGLTGTKYGCGAGICGACTVHVDGVAERACMKTVGEVAPWVGDVTVPLTFSLGKVEVTLKQLRSMQSGYTFETLAALEAPITIRAYDQEIGRGEIIQVEDRIGVRLVEMNYDERH